jgi:predicted DNA-binding protein
MPRQRAINKKMLGVYLSDDEYAAIRKISKMTGKTMTDLVKQFIENYSEENDEGADGKNRR